MPCLAVKLEVGLAVTADDRFGPPEYCTLGGVNCSPYRADGTRDKVGVTGANRDLNIYPDRSGLFPARRRENGCFLVENKSRREIPELAWCCCFRRTGETLRIDRLNR